MRAFLNIIVTKTRVSFEVDKLDFELCVNANLGEQLDGYADVQTDQ